MAMWSLQFMIFLVKDRENKRFSLVTGESNPGMCLCCASQLQHRWGPASSLPKGTITWWPNGKKVPQQFRWALLLQHLSPWLVALSSMNLPNSLLKLFCCQMWSQECYGLVCWPVLDELPHLAPIAAFISFSRAAHHSNVATRKMRHGQITCLGTESQLPN